MIDRLRPRALGVSITPLSGRAQSLAEVLRERLAAEGLQVVISRRPASDALPLLECCVVFVTTPAAPTESGLEACVFAIIAAPEPTASGSADESELQSLAARVAERIRRLR